MLVVCENRSEVLASLKELTEKKCNTAMFFANMQEQRRFEGITLSLAKARYKPAIPIIVKCIDISTRETGLTSSYWPAQTALRAFGKMAVVPLSEFLLQSKEELACSASGVLSSIGGSEAKAALIKALSENREPISHACVKAALANIRK